MRLLDIALVPQARAAHSDEYPSQFEEGGSRGARPQLLRSAIAFLSMNPRTLDAPGSSSTAAHKKGMLPRYRVTACSTGPSLAAKASRRIPLAKAAAAGLLFIPQDGHVGASPRC